MLKIKHAFICNKMQYYAVLFMSNALFKPVKERL